MRRGAGQLLSDLGPLIQDYRGLRRNPGTAVVVLRKTAVIAVLQLVYYLRRLMPGPPRPEVVFHPQKPDGYYTLWKVCMLLRVKRVDWSPDAQVIHMFEDDDFGSQRSPEERALPQGSHARVVINRDCTDISKTTVGRAFREVFGYDLSLDPTRHHGPALEKSDGNARHYGRVVECPLDAPEPGHAYQVVVDNRVPARGVRANLRSWAARDSEEWVESIRVPIVGSAIPFVYLKYRTLEDRFTEEYACPSIIRKTDEVLSNDEVERIIEVARRLKLDCGEADVVRDRTSGRIYLVDLNKTPYGPPGRIRLITAFRAMAKMARAYRAAYLSGPEPRATA